MRGRRSRKGGPIKQIAWFIDQLPDEKLINWSEGTKRIFEDVNMRLDTQGVF